MPKQYRPKCIGDPLKKFKGPSQQQTWWNAQRAFLEKTMEEDHRAGLSMRASMYSSSQSGMPDSWYFEKAKKLGYKIKDERVFIKEQLDDCFKTPDRLVQYVDTFMKVISLIFSKKEMDDLGPSFRESLLETLRREQAKGKHITFGMSDGNRTSPRKYEFAAGSKGRLVTWTKSDEQKELPESDRGPSEEIQAAPSAAGVPSAITETFGTDDGRGSPIR